MVSSPSNMDAPAQTMALSGPVRHHPASAPWSNTDGIALVMVLWVLVILTVIVGEFIASSRSQTQLVGNYMETTQAHYLAVAGVEQVLFEMATNRSFFDFYQPPPEASSEGTDRFQWRINASNPPFKFGQGWFLVRIDNVGGKVNINRANRPLLRIIVDRLKIDAEQKDVIVDAIMDWRDPDNIHRLNGAEDDYYAGISAEHLCKDGDFDSIDELHFVRGVTPDVFQELKTLFVVYPQRGDESVDDEPEKPGQPGFDWDHIDVNAASTAVLMHLPGMTSDDVQAIMRYREQRDIRNLTELATIISAEAYLLARPYLTVLSSPCFTISAVGAADHSPMITGLTTTVVRPRSLGKLGGMPRIIRQRSSVDDKLISDFRRQRELAASLQ